MCPTQSNGLQVTFAFSLGTGWVVPEKSETNSYVQTPVTLLTVEFPID